MAYTTINYNTNWVWPKQTITLTLTSTSSTATRIIPWGITTTGSCITSNIWPDTSTTFWPVPTFPLYTAPPKEVPLNHRARPRRAERAPDWATVTPEEQTALRLLRGLVHETEWRRYLKDGHIQATGPSGLLYVIHHSTHRRIQAWHRGQLIAELCIHLKGWTGKPPTDEVVAKLLMAEMDELDLWRRANITWRTAQEVPPLAHLGLRPGTHLRAAA